MTPIVSYRDHPPVLVIEGDEDVTTQGCRRRALSSALSAQADVLVDLRALAFADASLMVDLAMVARRLRMAGRRMLVQGAQPQIRLLVEATGLHRLDGVSVDDVTPSLG